MIQIGVEIFQVLTQKIFLGRKLSGKIAPGQIGGVGLHLLHGKLQILQPLSKLHIRCI